MTPPATRSASKKAAPPDIPTLLPPPSHNFTSRSRSRSRAASRRSSPAESLLEPATTTTLLPRRAKHSRGSICSDANRDKRKPFNNWLEQLTVLVNQATEDGFDEFDEFSAIQMTVEETTKKITLVDNFRKEHPDKDLKVATFSTVTSDDLDRIGLQRRDIDAGKLILAAQRSMTDPPRSAIQFSAVRVDGVLDDLREFVSTQNEAGARILINQLLLETRTVCKDLQKSLFIRVEVRLPGPGKSARYFYQNMATYVSGIIDYGVGVLDCEDVESELSSMKSANLQTIDVIIENGSDRQTFVVLEAKCDKQELLNHLAQVVFQCMALPEGVTSHKSQVVAFALANSTTWIFGTLHRKEPKCQKPVVYLSQPMTMVTDGGSTEIREMLYYWVTTDAESLYAMMEELHSP